MRVVKLPPLACPLCQSTSVLNFKGTIDCDSCGKSVAPSGAVTKRHFRSFSLSYRELEHKLHRASAHEDESDDVYERLTKQRR